MNFDWQAIFHAAIGAAAGAVSKTAPQVEDFLREIVSNKEEAVIELVRQRKAGELSPQTFDVELQDQMDVVEVELLAVAVTSRAIAQRAVNAFRETLIDGITKALKTALPI